MKAAPGPYPARRPQRYRLLTWLAARNRPTAASASTAPDVRRPVFAPVVYLFAGFLALSLAAFTAAHEAHALGWPLVEVGALFALCSIGCVAALLLRFPALVRWLW